MWSRDEIMTNVFKFKGIPVIDNVLISQKNTLFSFEMEEH